MAACAAMSAPICRRPCAACLPTGHAVRCRVSSASSSRLRGLADPGPVLQTFATDRALGREFHLQALITVVDAVDGARNLERMPEAKKQVALADRIVVSKSDLADPAAMGALDRATRRAERRARWRRRRRRYRAVLSARRARLAAARLRPRRSPSIPTGSAASR